MSTFTTNLKMGAKAYIVCSQGGGLYMVMEATVGQVRVVETHPKAIGPHHVGGCYVEQYMCFETGVVSGSIWTYGENIFLTEEDAERGRIKLEQKAYKIRMAEEARMAEKAAYHRERELRQLAELKAKYETGDKEGNGNED